MIRSAFDEDASQWEVVDLETGQVVPDVVWADDATHEYVQRIRDDQGRLMRDGQGGLAPARHVNDRRIQYRQKG